MYSPGLMLFDIEDDNDHNGVINICLYFLYFRPNYIKFHVDAQKTSWDICQFFVRRTIKSLHFLNRLNDITSISGHLFPIFLTSDTG
jgi:hypothetical protein